jgi:putative holliday junction resolvase
MSVGIRVPAGRCARAHGHVARTASSGAASRYGRLAGNPLPCPRKGTIVRVMALDYGERRIGVALSDALGLIATPRGAVERQEGRDAIGEIVAMCEAEGVEQVIVGLPVGLRLQEGASSEAARAFAAALEGRLAVPVELVDERLTTVVAERALLEGDVSRARRKRVIDGVSAAVLLTDYLGRARR